MKTQFLKRKIGNPFVFKGAQFPDVVLVLTGIKEFSGIGELGNRDVTVIITAAAYSDEAAMNANISDYLRTFSFEFTRTSFTSKEFTTGGQVDVSVTNNEVNASMLNLEYQGTELAMFKYDTEYAGGKVFTNAGLQALLQMPSITEGNTLGDEWEIPQ